MTKKEKKFNLFTKGSSDYALFIITMLLLALGIIMVLSASAPASLSEEGNSYKYLERQVQAAALGLVAMLVLSKIDNKIYTGIEIRNLLGLRSTDFDIVVNGDNVSITTKGYGHGVGMSQYGANELAKKGFNYNDIIKTYYQNVNIVKI